MNPRAIDVKSLLIGVLSGVCLMGVLGQAPAPATAPATAPAAAAALAHPRFDLSAVHVVNNGNVDQTVYIYDHQSHNVYTRSKGTQHNLWSEPVFEFKMPE